MTKEELIKRLIEMRKTGADETLDRVCESSTGCEDCPLYPTGRLCSHQTIDYLLDYIIELESKNETNLKHFEDSIFIKIIKDAHTAFINSDYKAVSDWLFAPYEEPKPKYKLTQFEIDFIYAYLGLNGEHCTLDSYMFNKLQSKGYFKDIPTDVPIKDILENAEVIDNG